MHFRIFFIVLVLFFFGCSNSTKENTAFIDQLAPSVKNGGFEMENFWVWGASVIKGEDGKYHMFASRWPKNKPFLTDIFLFRNCSGSGRQTRGAVYFSESSI